MITPKQGWRSLKRKAIRGPFEPRPPMAFARPGGVLTLTIDPNKRQHGADQIEVGYKRAGARTKS